ncbi:MAG: hypothetical protein LPK00_01855 [Bacillaceae bacterium]|nr:hypothetical protein [Bacillaceae bacterium]
MEFLVSLNLSIIFSILFFASNKKLNHLEHAFLWLIVIFIFTSITSSIVDNVKIWTLSEETKHHGTFKVIQLFGVPLIMMYFLNQLLFIKDWKKRITKFFGFIFILLFYEWTWVQAKIIEHTNWHFGFSFLLWAFLLLLILLLLHLFKRTLRKEGVST